MVKTKTLMILLIAASLLAASFAGCARRGAIELMGATPLATTPAWEENPVWSPDGSKIFFELVNLEEQKGYICVMNSDGSDVNRLAQGRDFILSPDGSKILFVAPEGQGIFIMNPDGSNKRNLPPFSYRSPSCSPFSPDGNKLCYYTSRPAGYYWVQEKSGGGWTRLSYMPQGAFCVAEEMLADIWVMDIDGSNQTKITPDIPHSGFCHWLAWSPDGEKILFQTSELSNDTVNIDIWTMNVDGSDMKRVTDYLGDDITPKWSPDGKKIAYRSGNVIYEEHPWIGEWVGGCFDIWVVNSDGTERRRLTESVGFDNRHFDWSPDGKKLAYVFHSHARPSQDKSEIWVMNADGSGKELLLSIPPANDVREIKWSSDGSKIAFVVWREPQSNTDIYLIDVPAS
jgi:TolB protein